MIAVVDTGDGLVVLVGTDASPIVQAAQNAAGRLSSWPYAPEVDLSSILLLEKIPDLGYFLGYHVVENHHIVKVRDSLLPPTGEADVVDSITTV